MNPAPSTPSPPALLTSTTTSRQWEKAKIGTSMPRSLHICVYIKCPCLLSYQTNLRLLCSKGHHRTIPGSHPLAEPSLNCWLVREKEPGGGRFRSQVVIPDKAGEGVYRFYQSGHTTCHYRDGHRRGESSEFLRWWITPRYLAAIK